MTLRAHTTSLPTQPRVTLLVLGAGWTYQFLQPQLEIKKSSISYAATTSNGRDNTIPFRFDPDSDDPEPFKSLPLADYVLITFPLKGKGPSRKMVSMYEETHQHGESQSSGTKWIQLGSTGVYTAGDWVDCKTPIDPSNERGIAEDELISLGGCVLNLAGLYGAQRQPTNWIARVAKTKEQLASKGALHLIHGVDVSRAIIASVEHDLKSHGSTQSGTESLSSTSTKVFGRRWIICDCVSYDWYQIVWDCTGTSEEEGSSTAEVQQDPAEESLAQMYRRWVFELMEENKIRALPRQPDSLGRKLDGREFWNTVALAPQRTLKR
jgi:hypothetical protein